MLLRSIADWEAKQISSRQHYPRGWRATPIQRALVWMGLAEIYFHEQHFVFDGKPFNGTFTLQTESIRLTAYGQSYFGKSQ